MFKGYKTGVRKKNITANELTSWTMSTLNENELSDLRDIQNAKRLIVCTFFSPSVD